MKSYTENADCPDSSTVVMPRIVVSGVNLSNKSVMPTQVVLTSYESFIPKKNKIP